MDKYLGAFIRITSYIYWCGNTRSLGYGWLTVRISKSLNSSQKNLLVPEKEIFRRDKSTPSHEQKIEGIGQRRVINVVTASWS